MSAVMVPQLSLLLPEMVLLGMACLILLIDLFVKDPQRWVTYWLSQCALAVVIGVTAGQYGLPPLTAFGESVILDDIGVVLKISIFGLSFLGLLYARDYINSRQFLRGEYYVLTLFAALGMSVMVSAYSLLTLYLGLEMLSLSLYTLVAMQRDSSVASEAAMKYFVMGALASGLLLYGMSMLYGATGSLGIAQIASEVLLHNGLVAQFAMVFIVVGLAFKLGAVPFHMWVPDVYQGAPTSVTALLSSAPKVAAFGLILRLLTDGLSGLQADWQTLLIVLSILSMAVGNIVAIAQSNFKRMLAYSAIAHMGCFLLGIISGTTVGYGASMFYVIVYAIMTLAAFGSILFFSRAGFECDQIQDFKGLWHAHPGYALLMLFVMMSMAGVPPLVGFWPKFQVIIAVVDAGLPWLAAVAVLFSIVGAYYYLRVVKILFFDAPPKLPLDALRVAPDMRIAVVVNGLAMLGLGIFPGYLTELCQQAFG